MYFLREAITLSAFKTALHHGTISMNIQNIRKPKYLRKHAQQDYELCKAVLAGNPRAFALLVSRYQKRIYTLGLSFFDNTEDCEDFTQDVMLKAYTNLSTFRGEGSFSAWLMRIAYNTAVNSAAKKEHYTSLAEGEDIAYPGETPEEKHMRNCIILSIREAIDNLPDHYRLCIDLYFFYDMSYADIASITNLPLNTIKSHIFRAKKLLKAYLSDDRVIFERSNTVLFFPCASMITAKGT
ncbi:MAG: RNA polymerase sigma factor [Treponema sp.]